MFHEFLNVDHLILSKTRITLSAKVKKEYYRVVVSNEFYNYLILNNIKIMDEDEFPAKVVSIDDTEANLRTLLYPVTEEALYVNVPKSLATKIKLMF